MTTLSWLKIYLRRRTNGMSGLSLLGRGVSLKKSASEEEGVKEKGGGEVCE